MKTILLLTLLAIPAAAQFSPCLVDTNPAPELIPDRRTMYPGVSPLMVPDPNRRPSWEPKEAFIEPAVRINPLAWYRFEFFMPVAGRCIGAFDSYSEENAAADLTRSVIGKYTGVAMAKPTGDVEVIIMTVDEYNAWAAGHSTTTRGGSLGKKTGGSFAVDLEPGWYVAVISNAHAGLYAKTVSFLFGGKFSQRRG